jgi:hypothetical protein
MIHRLPRDSDPARGPASECPVTLDKSSIARIGVHGDPLANGKLDLPELREAATEDEWTSAREFIRRRRWKEAVTYRKTAPHEYTIRDWQPDAGAVAEFEAFAEMIRRFGYADFFYKVRHIYWAVDEFKYWSMGWPIAETVVINRARVDAPEPWKTNEDR